eukprot:gene67051-91832_t
MSQDEQRRCFPGNNDRFVEILMEPDCALRCGPSGVAQIKTLFGSFQLILPAMGWRPGEDIMTRDRVTVVEIAHAAGVSKSTVSLVLQGSPLVGEATRAKVGAVIRELGYVYNRGAANLRQSNAKSKIIGFVVNDLTNSFFAELAVGVDMVVQSAGFVQFLSNS